MVKKSAKGKQKAVKNKLILIILIALIISVLSFYNFYEQGIKENLICKDCNVILISIDTLRADHLGVYGYHRNTSPNIDEFAKKSILFENAISQETWTVPSHISVFTSLYPLSHKVIGPQDTLNKFIITLPEILKSNGYTTVSFTGGAWTISPRSGLGKGFDVYEQINYSKTELKDLKKSSAHFLDESNPVFKWLQANHKEKFFLFFHTFSVHEPYITIKNYSKIFDPYYDGNILDSEEELLDLLWGNFVQNYSGKSNERTFLSDVVNPLLNNRINNSNAKDRNHIVAIYDGKILQTDEFIGFFLKRIKELGLFNNTIIILFSDHGEEFWEHDKRGHAQQLYEETIHAPLIMYNPHINQGIRLKEQAELVDIMPTILDMLDIKISSSLQGNSLLPLLGTSKDVNKYVFSTHGVDEASVRTNEWKLIFKTNGSHELYNLISDPKEIKNLVEERKDKFLELKEKLFDWGVSIGIKHDRLPVKSVEEELRKLGYIT